MKDKMTENQLKQMIAQLLTTVNPEKIDREKGQLAIKDPDFSTQFESFINSYELREKFRLLMDLGEIIIPDGYVSGTYLDSFEGEYEYNKDITDANSPSPSRILKPGDKLHVRAFEQIVDGTTTSKERMRFLNNQSGVVHLGAHGAKLVFEQKRDQLPKGKRYSSFDEKERLWKDAVGRHWVPSIFAFANGDFAFDLSFFGGNWNQHCVILSFCVEQF